MNTIEINKIIELLKITDKKEIEEIKTSFSKLVITRNYVGDIRLLEQDRENIERC